MIACRRGVQRGSARRSFLKRRAIATVSQTSTWTVSIRTWSKNMAGWLSLSDVEITNRVLLLVMVLLSTRWLNKAKRQYFTINSTNIIYLCPTCDLWPFPCKRLLAVEAASSKLRLADRFIWVSDYYYFIYLFFSRHEASLDMQPIPVIQPKFQGCIGLLSAAVDGR